MSQQAADNSFFGGIKDFFVAGSRLALDRVLENEFPERTPESANRVTDVTTQEQIASIGGVSISSRQVLIAAGLVLGGLGVMVLFVKAMK